MTRRAILWRHGRTAWNLANRFQGQLDVPLDDVGRGQAAQAADLLAGFRPALVVSSDLSRAAATAEALATVIGVGVESDPGLREADAGSWQGMTHAEIAERDADLLRRWRSASDVRPGHTGETRTEVGRRVAVAVDRHMDRLQSRSTAVFVTHGGAARAAVGHLLGLDALHWQRMAVLRNCAWAVMAVDAAGEWRLEAYNVAAVPPGAADPAAPLRDGIV